jgi:GMP synthase (glutamine-hydrolysing)
VRAVVFQHARSEGPGLLGEALRRAGFELECRVRSPRTDDVLADLLVVMGGPMGAYEVSAHPFLRTELEVLRDRLAQDRPTVGVCLGGQLLAAAAGARVFPGTAGFELGLSPVSATQEGRADPVFARLPPRLVQWHGDTWDAVPGAALLASTDRYPQQAFRIGRSYGVQFHPELTPEVLVEWARESPADLQRAGLTLTAIEEHAAGLRSEVPAITAFLDALAARIAGWVGSNVRAGA